MQEALETIHRKTLQHFPLNPLQKNTRIPFEMFNAPLKIREDLEFKRKSYKADKEKEYKDVTDPSDLFEVDGRPAENIYMLGEAGRGKTGQCYQLIQHWIEARESHKGSKELSNWQKALVVFDFLFFVSLRHVDNRISSIVEMICKCVMKTYPQYHDTVRQILTSGLHKCTCLIVIDGLDEMKGEVDINVDMSRCTVLRTSRHWKFHDLAPDINDLDRVVEVFGLDDDGKKQIIQKILVNYFGIADKSEELHGKVEETLEKILGEKYKSLMDIPLLLTASVYLWQSNTSPQESLTSFYAALLNLLIKLAFDNKRVTKIPVVRQSMTKIDFPSFMTKQRKMRGHIEVLVLIGRVAYEDLVLGNRKFENPEKEKYEGRQRVGTSQLVFEKDELLDKLGGEVLTFTLEVGLLSQSSAPGSFDDDNVSINFFHKTIEEFLAALYLVCSDEVSFDSFLLSCSGLKSIMELSNMSMFVMGLQPSLGNTIAKHIAKTADTDPELIRFRQGIHDDNNKVKLLFNTLCNCAKEMEYSLTQSEISTKDNTFLVSDVYMDSTSDKWTAAFTTKLLQRDYIVSLMVDNSFTKECIPFSVVEKFLDKSSSLQALFFEGKRDLPAWQRISRIFSSLTSVFLNNVSLTNEAGRMLQDAIQSNTKIKSLKLEFVRIHFLYIGTAAYLEKAMRLYLKNNKQLRILNITSSHCLLEDITHCKLLVNLCLNDIQIQGADMLQAALFSFTQLQDLVLKDISFPNDERDKWCLDLTANTGLKKLECTNIHVASIKISPISLRDLTICSVSGSLRGLLSALPECQHLTNLSFRSVSDEQDVNLLKDILPALSHVRCMTYNVGTQWDTESDGVAECHSAVSQATTRMTGLEYLFVEDIDMGDMTLTLIPLMTDIKCVTLALVEMTASSWGEFIASLLTIQHQFEIDLYFTNIDDESVSTVHSSPLFNVRHVTKPLQGGEYYSLLFSKLSS